MEELLVIKIGGNVIDQEELLLKFLDSLSLIPAPFILVHGGGKVASQVSQKLDITPQVIEGRRLTDKDTLNVVTMVYGGLINKNLVAKLQARDVSALGLSGADGNLIRAKRRPIGEVDYGFVGDVVEINTSFLTTLLQAGYCPVVCPLTHDGQGQLFNTNADTIASSLATALASQFRVKLIYCFELPGILRDPKDPSSLLSEVTPTSYSRLKQEKIISGGMIPKVDNCFAAIAQGVESVHICHAKKLSSLLSGEKESGTCLRG